MRKQKLLLIVTKGNWGGGQRYVYDLATHLPKRAFKVTVAVGEGSILPAKLAEAEVRVIPLSHLGRNVRVNNDLKSFLSLISLFRRERPDIVHLNSSKAGALGALAARLARVPRIIFTAHGWAFNEERPRWTKIVIAFLHWLTILLAHRVIVVAVAARRQMDCFPFTKQRMTVIRNGLPEINFLDRPIARRELLGGKSLTRGSSWWLGTISELHKNKGLEYLIRALTLLKISPAHDNSGQAETPTLIIIGEGEERGNLEKLIKDLRLEEQVFLLGHKNNAPQYLKAFDLFTLTSITEALPYVLLEAGAAALPIIASGVGGIPEIITSMHSGVLVKPRQPREIADALGFLLTHPAKASQFGRTLQQRIIKEFPLARMIKETIAVYGS